MDLSNWNYVRIDLILLVGGLLTMMIIMLTYFRRMMGALRDSRPMDWNPYRIRKWVEESEAICEKLSEMIEERKQIADRLIAHLDERIQTLCSMISSLDQVNLPIVEEVYGEEQAGRIQKMAEEGQKFSDIAKQTGRTIGEIELMMNLKKSQESSPFKI